MAARSTLATSNTVKTRVNGLFKSTPAITRIGTTKREICVPEPAAMPIDRSIFPFLARRMALLCSAAFPTIPMIIAPTNNSPNPNSAVTTSIDPTRIPLIIITPAILNPSKMNDFHVNKQVETIKYERGLTRSRRD